MKFHLQSLLDAKEKQLLQAGMLGQRVLAQQTELEERIRQLQDLEWEALAEDADGDAEGVGNAAAGESGGAIAKEVKERYRELTEALSAWDEENVQLSSVFASRVGLIHCFPFYFILFYFFLLGRER
jgi:hypothetical protein